MTMEDVMKVVDKQLKSGEFTKDSMPNCTTVTPALKRRRSELEAKLEATSEEILSYRNRGKKVPFGLLQNYDRLQEQLDTLGS